MNNENNMDHHDEDHELSYSSDETNDSIVPSSKKLRSWCERRTNQLEIATKTARSKAIEYKREIKEEVIEENSVPRNSANNDGTTYQNYPKLPRSFPSASFRGDLSYFEQNKHPSILHMLKISEETGVRYDNVFYRFCQLRVMNNAVCHSNDSCERVLKYFDPKTVYAIPSLEEKDMPLLHEEFKRFGYAGPVLCTGNVHLIAEKFFLPPNVIREYFFEWYSNSHKKSPDITMLIFDEQKLYDEEMSRKKDPPAALVDHDYGKEMSSSFKIRSILRIIKKKPDLTVSDALILSKLYKMDIKFIQKLIQDDEDVMFTVQHSGDNNVYFQEQCIPVERHSEVVQDPELRRSKRISQNRDCDSSSCGRPLQSSINHFDANSMLVTQYEDVVGYDSEDVLQSSTQPIKTEELFDTDVPGDRFPEDFVYFEKNRHPSIQEMINISKRMGITYRQVYYRFRDFRCAFKVNCPENDICRKVQKFFAQRAVFSGVLDATSVNTMYDLFEHYGHVGKNPDIGYTHLIAEKVDLPAFIVREQYKEWFAETADLDPTERDKRLENINQNLENEFNKNSKLSYERLVHLANKYDTTQKIILNFYESYSQRFMKNLNKKPVTSTLVPMIESSSSPTEPDSSSVLSRFEPPKVEDNRLYVLDSESIQEEDTLESGAINEKQLMKNCFYEAHDGSMHDLFKITMNLSQSDIISKSENVLKAMKLKFNMNNPLPSSDRSSNSKRIKLNHHDMESSSQHTETEDEEIDIVGFDESVKQTPVDELAKTFVDSYPDIHEFPGDSEIFDKNRHPSIQDMIDISQDVGVTYEQVFQRFQHLRKLKNETCTVGDICQKVEMYSQSYSSLNGVLDETVRNTMKEEFAKFPIEFGPILPLGHVHLIMEKVGLPWSVVSVQYAEWYAEMERQKESNVSSASTSSLAISPQTDAANTLIEETIVSLKKTHENDDQS
ncbi:hypothetical protein CAEBREN_18431 [Caenorhabditis brenneri]|uniref:Homeobox-cysteine loop-homeobox domain-containing protein n=1 Tax=Caenorhabditis brenneri TaxID=135651 RepID=G0PI76_CAEBE|nr:hypothetical protein CAEBREN_18431 [Caenorhabditis brenneri]